MGRKGGLTSIFSTSRHSKPGAATSPILPSSPWPWPSCATKPQTASFRGQGGGDDDRQPCTTAAAGRRRFDQAAAAPGGGGRLRPPRGAAPGDEMYRTVNSVYFDAADSCRFFFDDDGGDAAEDDVIDDGSFSTTTASEEWSEAVIRSLGRTSTDRFFFDAGPPAPTAASNSILAASPSPGRTLAPPAPPIEAPGLLQAALAPYAAGAMLSDAAPVGSGSDDDEASDAETETEVPSTSSLVEESVAVALDSEDPFRDFRASMHEMVAAHGLRDWPALQEMLLWYLRINGKHNHALIVGAFVDLLVGLATSTSSASPSATTTGTTTATMTTTTTTAYCCSSTSSSSSTSSGGGGATNTTTAAVAPAATMDEQCGISAGASCSSPASSDLEEEAAAGERSNNGHCTSSDALDSSCS
ncbi:nuclear pore complex protein NUP62-like [Miscanthus floridulus]|uniref:nuclear pore complex protein NUP62-like n=1 Tax=Miscanthus floridulus TaxID=154761 RepID=UPI0034588B84